MEMSWQTPQRQEVNEIQKSSSIGKPSTMSSLIFLLLSLPMGIFFFTITVTFLSLGVSTVIIWIGLPILLAALLLIRGMAFVELRMAAGLLHLPLMPRSRRHREGPRGFIGRLGTILTDPLTWTSVFYMLLKLPLGIISFTLALVLPIVSLSLTLMPLAYLINLMVNTILLANGIQSSGIMIPYFIEVHGPFDLVMFTRSFIGVPIGIGMWFVTRYIINGLAQASGELAYALLADEEAE